MENVHHNESLGRFCADNDMNDAMSMLMNIFFLYHCIRSDGTFLYGS